MDHWKAVLYLLASGQGFLLSTALVVSRHRNRANLFLGLILLVFSLELLNAWGMQVGYHRSPNAFPFWIFQSYLLLPPAVAFYARASLEPRAGWSWNYAWFFLPAGIQVLAEVVWTLRRRVLHESLKPLLASKGWFLFADILPIIGMVLALSYYGQQLWARRNQASEQISIPHLGKRYGLFVFLVLLTGFWIAGVLVDWPVFGTLELGLTGLLFAFGYWGYLDSGFFKPNTLPNQAPPENPFPQYDDQREFERVREYFQQQRLHTRSKLSVEDLAAALHLPERYVSYLINTRQGQNFSQFVNAYRVEEVIRKLKDPTQQHKTLLALALEAGFSSKSAFNQVFKSHTGQTPSEFMRRQGVKAD